MDESFYGDEPYRETVWPGDQDDGLSEVSFLARNLNDDALWDVTRKAVKKMGMDEEVLEESREELLASVHELRRAPETEISLDELEIRQLRVALDLCSLHTPKLESADRKLSQALKLETGSGGKFA